MVDVETERRNRIRLSLGAYQYELAPLSEPYMSDAEWDVLALKINHDMPTGHVVVDDFFKHWVTTDTGQWIHEHPELDKLIVLHLRLQQDKIWRQENDR